ncbi:DUF2171 domain-containing protein [Sphingomonas sp.]|uniref:DUF2171 domain-containing protein n=1 Tax=Sphingomonas sp. TaxID=28214 RepID=UPI001EBAB866|nr:DUF2171 domain-containing protein [Sphingomonas sp.]MBX3594874.1 DUF2171 domain-containing protein [Sphingomonas sp.]
MGYDRTPRTERGDDYRWRDDNDYGRDTGYDYGRSSARDDAAAGGYDRERYRGQDYYGSRFVRGEGRFDQGRHDHGGWDRDGGRTRGDLRARDDDWGRGRQDRRPSPGRAMRRPEGYSYDDRDFFSRAGDEIRSWFGDDEAERRREMDARYDLRHGNSWSGDDHYRGWRNRQIADLDRDYDEYRRENASRFENEFGAWRNERRTQRASLGQIEEHMDVVGSDGEHVGKVDKVRGDRIILTKSDPDAGGHHHSIPSRWIDRVDDKVHIRKTAAAAQDAWRDEERSGAMFGERDESRGAHYLNRSFSGTY